MTDNRQPILLNESRVLRYRLSVIGSRSSVHLACRMPPQPTARFASPSRRTSTSTGSSAFFAARTVVSLEAVREREYHHSCVRLDGKPVTLALYRASER